MDTWGISLAWGQMNIPTKMFGEGKKEAGGKEKLCMVARHSCYIHGTWRSKKVGRGGLKSLYGWLGGKPEREDFYGVELAPPDAMIN